jgi:aspartate 1-decarboxylase
MRWVLRSKIHKAIVTEANLAYVGSITIDSQLVERAGFFEGEKVLIASNDSGARLETYIILGESGTGNICMNGAAAHLVKPGEEIIIMGFELSEAPLKPTVILVDRQNRFVRYLEKEIPQNGLTCRTHSCHAAFAPGVRLPKIKKHNDIYRVGKYTILHPRSPSPGLKGATKAGWRPAIY